MKSKTLGRSGQELAKVGLLYSVFAGNDKAYYARWVEFGTSDGVKGQRVGVRDTDYNQHKTRGRKSYRTHGGTPAQPFFYPTVRALKKPITRKVVRRVNLAAKAVAALR